MADYKEAYSELYKRVLGDTMAEDTPYNKFTTKIDEYFEKYGLANDKKFEMLCSTLVSMTQSVTTSSQDRRCGCQTQRARARSDGKKAKFGRSRGGI